MRKHLKLKVLGVVGVVAAGLIATTVAIGVPSNDGKLIVENTKGASLATSEVTPLSPNPYGLPAGVSFEVLAGPYGLSAGTLPPGVFDLFGRPNPTTPGTTISCNPSKDSIVIKNGAQAPPLGSVSGTPFTTPKPSFSACKASGPLWAAVSSPPTAAAVKTKYTLPAPTNSGWQSLYTDGDSANTDEDLGAGGNDTIGITADNGDLISSVGLPAAITGATGGGVSPAGSSILGCEVVNSDGTGDGPLGPLPSTTTGAYNDLSGVLSFSAQHFGIEMIQNPASTKTCPTTDHLPNNPALGALANQTINVVNSYGVVSFTGTYDLVPVVGDR